MMLVLAFGPVFLLWLLFVVIIARPGDHNYVGHPLSEAEQLRRMYIAWARELARAHSAWVNQALIPSFFALGESFKVASFSMAQLNAALQSEEESDGPAVLADSRD